MMIATFLLAARYRDLRFASSGCALSRLALRVFWLRAIALALRVRPEGLGKQNILTENEPGDL